MPGTFKEVSWGDRVVPPPLNDGNTLCTYYIDEIYYIFVVFLLYTWLKQTFYTYSVDRLLYLGTYGGT